MIGRGLAIAVAVAILIAAPARAWADDAADEAAFGAATQKLGHGDLAAARAELEALAARAPAGRWADDALAEAAAIAERQGDLAGARALWRRLIAAYPASNQARRAGPRLASLEAAAGPDGQWDAVAAAHARLEREAAAQEDPTPSLRALGDVLDANPGYPRWFAAALWLGQRWADVGERGLAARWTDQAGAAARDGGERFRAGMAKGDLLATAGDFDAAERVYRGLAATDEVAAGAVADALDDVAWARLRWRLGKGAWIALAVCAAMGVVALRRRAGSWRGARQALWPPPLEVVFLVPVAVVLGVLAETGNLLAARATEMILVGAIGIAWLGGAVMKAGRGSGAGMVVVHVAVVTVAVVALCYAAVAHDQLLELLIETWKHGHELH